MEFQKDIHYSPDLEAAILGASMLEKTAFGRTHGVLKEEIFYTNANQVTYRAINELYSTGLPVDILTVTDRIRRVYAIENLAGDQVGYYLARLTNARGIIRKYRIPLLDIEKDVDGAGSNQADDRRHPVGR
jgi:replicative DNA helicase